MEKFTATEEIEMVNFNVTKLEMRTITRIAQRAVHNANDAKIKYDFMDCEMDVTACHANGMRLDLDRLLEADDFNFNHDIFGIRRHLNRENGKIENCFVPRFHKQKRAAA